MESKQAEEEEQSKEEEKTEEVEKESVELITEESQKVSDEELEEEKMTMMTGSTYADTNEQEMEKRQELLDFLFSFLEDVGKELNPVLCGYFCKMVNCLLTKRTKQTITYLYTHSHILVNMVRHLESRGVYELLMRILRIDNSVAEELDVEISVQKARVIDFLAD